MNKLSPIGRSHKAPSAPRAVDPARSPVAGSTACFTRIARVPGEAFDADQIGWSCDECGRDEYGCDCEIEADYPPTTKSREQIEADHRVALAKIAAVFLGAAK
jgi:hypothetical protein